MRILMATDQWYADLKGGIARVASDMAFGLAAAGHEVEVIAPAHPGAPATERHPEGVVVHRVLPRSRIPVILGDPVHTRNAARSLGGRFDVVVGHTCTTSAGLISARLGAPLVYVFHADVAREIAYLREADPAAVGPGAVSHVSERYLRALDRWSLRRSKAIIVLSEFSRGLLHDLAPDVARGAILVPGGVDTSVFQPAERAAARDALGIAPDTRLLFTVRRLVTRMGLENLVDAVASLGASPQLELRIAGDGPLRSSLAARCERLGVSDRVRLLGRVSEPDLLLLYRAADLFVLPTTAYEGFGLVTAEALACGTPVVGTPVGATPELLEPLEPALLARSAEPGDLADAIRGALEIVTPELRAASRAHAVERYSLDSVVPQWQAVIAKAAEIDGPARDGVRERGLIDLASTIVSAGARPLVRRATRGGGRAGVILYHDPAPAVLEQHLRALSRRHPFVPYSVVVEALLSGDWDTVPPGALAVTFDDAHRRNIELAPVLAAYGVRPTIFVCSGILGTEQPFWWTLPGIDVAALKRVPNRDRVAAVAEGLASTRRRGALSLDELERLRPLIEIGSHTVTHPILPMCDEAEAEHEIVESRSALEQLLGQPCLDFAFPNGDYGAREIAILRRAGYRSARTIEPGWVGPDSDPFRLPIVPMPDDASPRRAEAQVALSALAPRVLRGIARA